MLTLAFDTATPAVTVALCDGGVAVAEVFDLDARRHGELLAPGIERVMAQAGRALRDVEGVVVGVGPGPYTSLRVGLVTAQALGHVLDVPVDGVCTLDALALAADLPGEFLVATDARRREVYWARYADGARVDGPGVARAADLHWDGPVVGYGAELYPDALPNRHGPLHPRAADLARHCLLGRPVLPPLPLYLRKPDATVPGARKSVLT